MPEKQLESYVLETPKQSSGFTFSLKPSLPTTVKTLSFLFSLCLGQYLSSSGPCWTPCMKSYASCLSSSLGLEMPEIYDLMIVILAAYTNCSINA